MARGRRLTHHSTCDYRGFRDPGASSPSGRRTICFCPRQGSQRPRCPPAFSVSGPVTPLTAGRPLAEGRGRASLSPWSAGLQFAGVTGRWQRLHVLPSRAEAGSALTRLPRAGQAPRIAPLTQGAAPRYPPRGAKTWLFTQWGSHAVHRPPSGQPCLSFPLCVCLLLRTFLNRHRNRDNHKLNIGLSLVFDMIVNIKDYGLGLLIFILFYFILFFFSFHLFLLVGG